MQRIIVTGNPETIIDRLIEALRELVEESDCGDSLYISTTVYVHDVECFRKLLSDVAVALGVENSNQSELARVFGISQGTLSKVLSAGRLPLKIYGRIMAVSDPSVPPSLLDELKTYVHSNDKMRW